MRFCTQCGAQLSDESKFCTNCGARIDAAEAPEEKTTYADIPVKPVEEERPWNSWDMPRETPKQPDNSYTQPQPGYVPGNNGGNKGGKKNGLIIGLVVALAVVIIALVVVLIGGGKDDPDPTTPTGGSSFQLPEIAATEAAAISPVGHWELVEIESTNSDEAVSAEDVQMLRDLGYVMYIEFYADGTGKAEIGDVMEFTWEDGVVTSDGVPNDYFIEGNMLGLVEGGTTIWFTSDNLSGGASIDVPVDVPATSNTALTSCNGDYFGWWIIDTVTLNSANQEGNWWAEGNWWDCCAQVKINEDGTGTILFWDEDLPRDNALSDANFSVSVNEEGHLEFIATGGWFMDGGMSYADMVGSSDDVDSEDGIWFAGQYTDPNNDFGFEYYIYLRPWGQDWKDFESDPNKAGLLPYEMDWYRGLIASGVTKAPGEIGG